MGVHVSFDGPKASSAPFYRKDLSRFAEVKPGTYPQLCFGEILPPSVAEFVPKTAIYTLKRPRKSVFKPTDAKPSSRFIISSKLKDILDHLEPGVHQYFPIRTSIQVGDKEIYSHDGYYLLNIGTLLKGFSSLNMEAMGKYLTEEKKILPDGRVLFSSKIDVDRKNIVLQAGVTGRFHIWRTASGSIGSDLNADGAHFEMGPTQIFISDRLFEICQRDGVRGMRFLEIKEA